NSGNFSWAKTIGGLGNDYAYSVQQTSDGGYIVGGETESFGTGGCDTFLLKLDNSGNFSWAKTIGGLGNDYAYSVQQTSDGGYIVGGFTDSFGAGSEDIFLLKFDSSGNLSWAKVIGGGGSDWAHSVQQTSDGGYIVGGFTDSFGAGGKDIFLIKTDSKGNIIDCPYFHPASPTVDFPSLTVSSVSLTISSSSLTPSSFSPSITSPSPTIATQCSAHSEVEDILIVSSSGKVGIKTTNPAYTLEVNGSFAATSKNFDIQDPRYNDPHRRLIHSSLEGPEHAVFYRGEAKLKNGKAIIKLPDYFEALTRKEGRSVILTCKNGWSPLYIEGEIENGKFIVRTTKNGNPNQEFYWEVKAIRADVPPLKVEVRK
ncbi:hypothetical protein J7K91_00920, partial [bacterium]|nr:hypothetical protein [bacterium]